MKKILLMFVSTVVGVLASSSPVSATPIFDDCSPTIPGCPGYTPIEIPLLPVEKQSQTITFPALYDVQEGESIELSATASSDLHVTYTTNDERICTVDGSILLTSTPGTCIVTAHQTGDEAYLPATDVPQTMNVEDDDGVSSKDENNGPNSGDGNNDGTKDSEQKTVATFNTDGTYITIAIQSSQSVTLRNTSAGADPCSVRSVKLKKECLTTHFDLPDGSTFPVGGFSFVIVNDDEGILDPVTVTIYIDGSFDTALWTYKKYAPYLGTLLDGPSVTATVVPVGSTTRTKLTYTLTDNGQFDMESVDNGGEGANGYILDPLFPVLPPAPPAVGGGNGPVAGSQVYVPVVFTPPATTTPTVPTTPTVLGASTSVIEQTKEEQFGEKCEKYLTDFIQIGKKNNPEQVTRLQTVLRDFEGYNVPVNGFFDTATYNAVHALQDRYKEYVLEPWGLTHTTGYTYLTTRRMVNIIYCEHTQDFALTEQERKIINTLRAKTASTPYTPRTYSGTSRSPVDITKRPRSFVRTVTGGIATYTTSTSPSAKTYIPVQAEDRAAQQDTTPTTSTR